MVLPLCLPYLSALFIIAVNAPSPASACRCARHCWWFLLLFLLVPRCQDGQPGRPLLQPPPLCPFPSCSSPELCYKFGISAWMHETGLWWCSLIIWCPWTQEYDLTSEAPSSRDHLWIQHYVASIAGILNVPGGDAFWDLFNLRVLALLFSWNKFL